MTPNTLIRVPGAETTVVGLEHVCSIERVDNGTGRRASWVLVFGYQHMRCPGVDPVAIVQAADRIGVCFVELRTTTINQRAECKTDPVWVNAAKICTVQPGRAGTLILMPGGYPAVPEVVVEESVDEVVAAIQKARTRTELAVKAAAACMG